MLYILHIMLYNEPKEQIQNINSKTIFWLISLTDSGKNLNFIIMILIK
ncbi:MAG: hypothetical protein K0R92_3446 [Lachnospiraceae bacterium]|nr:hypothetical protein [Lachnospiraceae bacterium]